MPRGVPHTVVSDHSMESFCARSLRSQESPTIIAAITASLPRYMAEPDPGMPGETTALSAGGGIEPKLV